MYCKCDRLCSAVDLLLLQHNTSVTFLLESGADPDIQNELGDTPLHCATWKEVSVHTVYVQPIVIPVYNGHYIIMQITYYIHYLSITARLLCPMMF